MAVRLETKQFKDAVFAVYPALGDENVLEQSSCIILRGSQVAAYDGEVCIASNLDKDAEIEAAVSGKKLYDLLNKTDPAEFTHVSLSVRGNDLRLRFRKDARASIRLDSEIRVPLNEIEQSAAEGQSLPAEFADALKMATLTTNANAKKFALSCVRLNGKRIESTDNFQALRYECQTELPGMLIPAYIAKMLYTFLTYGNTPGGEWTVSTTQNWAHFRNLSTNMRFSFRRVDESWPIDLDKMLNFEQQSEFNLPEKTPQALERAKIFSEDALKQTEIVKVHGDNEGGLYITGQDDISWYTEKLAKDYDEGLPTFYINPQFLSQVCKMSNVVEVGENLVRIRGEKFTYAALLASKWLKGE